MADDLSRAEVSNAGIANATGCVRPFLGSLASCAFRVRDEKTFEADPVIDRMMRDLDVLRGHLPEEAVPVFCLVRDMAPYAPLLVWRESGLSVLDEQASHMVHFDDSQGWIAGLQRHLDPDYTIVVKEYLSPDAPEKELVWVIFHEAAVCCLLPAEEGGVWLAHLEAPIGGGGTA